MDRQPSTTEAATFMQCAECHSQGATVYCQFKKCQHYVCGACVVGVHQLSGLRIQDQQCSTCAYDQDPEQYLTSCPTCMIEYTPVCPRDTHDCLLDEGVFDL